MSHEDAMYQLDALLVRFNHASSADAKNDIREEFNDIAQSEFGVKAKHSSGHTTYAVSVDTCMKMLGRLCQSTNPNCLITDFIVATQMPICELRDICDDQIGCFNFCCSPTACVFIIDAYPKIPADVIAQYLRYDPSCLECDMVSSFIIRHWILQ